MEELLNKCLLGRIDYEENEIYGIEIYDKGELKEYIEIKKEEFEHIPHPLKIGTSFRISIHKLNEEIQYNILPKEIYFSPELQRNFFNSIKEGIKNKNKQIDEQVRSIRGKAQFINLDKQLIDTLLSYKLDDEEISAEIKEIDDLENGNFEERVIYIHHFMHYVENFWKDLC